MIINGLTLRSFALLGALCCTAIGHAQNYSGTAPPSPLRLAAPLPTPPFNVPPLRIGSYHTAPVMPAAPASACPCRADSALQSTAPKLLNQSTIYLAEPQAGSRPSAEPVAQPAESSGAVAQRLQQATEGKLSWIKPKSAEAMEAGQAKAQRLRKASDFALGINRCPSCGKRRPDYNRIRIGIVRTRNFVRTGEGEERIALSPNAGPAS